MRWLWAWVDHHIERILTDMYAAIDAEDDDDV